LTNLGISAKGGKKKKKKKKKKQDKKQKKEQKKIKIKKKNNKKKKKKKKKKQKKAKVAPMGGRSSLLTAPTGGRWLFRQPTIHWADGRGAREEKIKRKQNSANSQGKEIFGPAGVRSRFNQGASGIFRITAPLPPENRQQHRGRLLKLTGGV